MPCKQLHNNRGSTLLMVIIVFAMLLIFGMAAIALSANAHRNAVTDYQTQQAYFTARSAVLAAVDYVKAAPDPKALLESLDGKTSNKTTDAQLGSYDLTVKKLDDTHYQISSLASVHGAEREYYTVLEVASDSPFKNLASITGENNFSEFNNMNKSWGDIYIQKRSDNQTTRIQYIEVHGDLVVDGDVKFGGGGGQISVYGDIYVNGKADFDDCQVNKIDGSLWVWGDIYFGSLNGGSQNPSTLTGENYATGNATSKPIGGKPVKPMPADKEFPENKPVPLPQSTDPVFSPPSKITVPTSYPSRAGNYVVGNGTVNPSFFPQNSDTVFDASMEDLYIIFSKGNYSFSNRKISVKGNHNVFIYLKDDVTIEVANDSQFGDIHAVKSGSFSQESNWVFDYNNINHAPKMTIISASPSAKLVFNDRCLLSAYVYMPFSKIETSAGCFCGSLFVGAVTSKANTTFVYIPPEPSSTPPGPGGGGGGGVSVVGNYSGKSKLGTP